MAVYDLFNTGIVAVITSLPEAITSRVLWLLIHPEIKCTKIIV